MKTYELDSRRDFNNIIYHTAMAAVLKLAIADEDKDNIPKFVGDFDNTRITDEFFRDIFDLVWQEYKKLGGDDTAAKGTDFVANIVKSLEEAVGIEPTPQIE
ncbi:hypothetical protein [Cedecea sp.]|uniref:hypothetical protein n=1 Tax=Cedecea sp. TaxID=1970739 RepID=UPI002F41613A